MAHPKRARCPGFTLVETLVVLAVVGVLLGAASLGLQDMVRSSRLSAATFRFVAEVNHARADAIRSGVRVVLCKSADGEACAAGGGWDQGWIVFRDSNNNASRDGAEVVLRRAEAEAGGLRIAGNELVARYLSFDPFGGARLVGGAFQAGTITVCSASALPTQARHVVINAVGRVRVERASVPDCP